LLDGVSARAFETASGFMNSKIEDGIPLTEKYNGLQTCFKTPFKKGTFLPLVKGKEDLVPSVYTIVT
jgi:hypothetical protein